MSVDEESQALSSWRTWIWGPGFFLFFLTVGLGLAASLIMGGIQIQGAPAPMPVVAMALVALGAGVWVVGLVASTTSLVRLQDGKLRVRRLVRSWDVPLECLDRASLDFDTTWGGQHPIRLDFVSEAPVRTVRFLLHERLDRGDLQHLLGTHVHDEARSAE